MEHSIDVSISYTTLCKGAAQVGKYELAVMLTTKRM